MNFVGASSGGAFGVIRRKLSTREEATVREVFDLFDEEGSGCISRDEVMS
jgi:Ca2+-binding EF-hand superfamily protein